MVAMARPAPLTQQPTSPSSLMKVSPASRALTSAGSSELSSRSASISGLAEELVVVDVHLGVDRLDLARRGGDQRVDLGERGAGLDEGAVELLHDLRGRALLLDVVVQLGREPVRLVRQQAVARVDGELADRVGVGVRDLLDVHAALGGDHEDRASCCRGRG
jgi:hypothetical protein